MSIKDKKWNYFYLLPTSCIHYLCDHASFSLNVIFQTQLQGKFYVFAFEFTILSTFSSVKDKPMEPELKFQAPTPAPGI